MPEKMEEIRKAIMRENPGMDELKAYAIAWSQYKKEGSSVDEDNKSCVYCNGEGEIDNKDCPHCGGTGLVPIQKEQGTTETSATSTIEAAERRGIGRCPKCGSTMIQYDDVHHEASCMRCGWTGPESSLEEAGMLESIGKEEEKKNAEERMKNPPEEKKNEFLWKREKSAAGSWKGYEVSDKTWEEKLQAMKDTAKKMNEERKQAGAELYVPYAEQKKKAEAGK